MFSPTTSLGEFNDSNGVWSKIAVASHDSVDVRAAECADRYLIVPHKIQILRDDHANVSTLLHQFPQISCRFVKAPWLFLNN